jgi:hypothetical protein
MLATGDAIQVGRESILLWICRSKELLRVQGLALLDSIVTYESVGA